MHAGTYFHISFQESVNSFHRVLSTIKLSIQDARKHEKKVFDLQSIPVFIHALDMSKTLSTRGTHVNTASQRTSFEQSFICKE